ncbi:family 16 glycosylhydrolase [Lutibacter sp. TH_r2]|uniref:family 16 glycosylhydrolase n=1 Tax=Lutibacter sp. TH_r2 TaxID=3082083 RepID=UPI0029531AB4|nr:family 16 glycosylhydrolase [Lutibacter sp. TH_r2]MDV7185901.1 family 16 glycosylhydrolase [Lutibacter sp. TH_r2]
MKYLKNIAKQVLVLILFIAASTIYAQKAPTFLKGEDPKPSDKKWKLIKNMSDEFNGKKLDEAKWQSSGQGWKGRAPGLFLPENVIVADGSLQITTTKMDKTVIKNNKEFTHGGGYVGSRNGMKYGYYECSMKANKTFMSSTFWLINENRGVQGCDRRTTELDIQECVGQIVNDAKWMEFFDQRMNSNTHSRNIPEGCDYKKGTSKGGGDLGGKVYDDYHVYGVWWKSKDEVLFFLDGKLVKKVTPPADFNIPMHLRMVVETYDWNPVPADGGMNKSKEDRTTNYDWVRSWKLVK